MCKLKLMSILLFSSLSISQLSCMEGSLEVLRVRLNDLSAALQWQEEQVPPPPPQEPGEIEELFKELPAPTPPTEGPIKPIYTGPLPPPPSFTSSDKPPVMPVAVPEVKPSGENIPPTEPEKPSDIKAKLQQVFPAGGPEQPKKPLKIIPTVKKVAETTVPKIDITMSAQINAYMQQLRAKPTQTVAQKVEKKAFARGVLNGLLVWAEKKKGGSTEAVSAVNEILAIDPLLISTAALVLEKMGFTKKDIYLTMTKLYQERVDFIGQEINKIKMGKVYAGIRDDIDEAIAYPIELSGALQYAKNQITLKTADEKVSQDFVNRMVDLKAQLCRHITDNIELFDPMYRDFYRSFCEEGTKPDIVYCITAVRPGVNKYVPIGDALKDVLARIEAYKINQKQYWASKRIFELQYMVNTLTGFIDFFTHPRFCKICIMEDIERMQKEQFLYKQKLAEIKQFLLALAGQEQNVYLRAVVEVEIPRLENLLEVHACKLRKGAGQAEFGKAFEEEFSEGSEEGYGSDEDDASF